MTIERDLLRRAWPQGCLPVRGVQTITGWMFASNCVIFHPDGYYQRGVAERTSTLVHLPGKSSHEVQGWIDEGDLLPNVDPRDAATWGCLLTDLVAAAAGVETSSGVQAQWEQTTWPHEGSSWILTWETMDGFQGATRFDFPDSVDDPSLALVLARISLTEKDTQSQTSSCPARPQTGNSAPSNSSSTTTGGRYDIFQCPGESISVSGERRS